MSDDDDPRTMEELRNWQASDRKCPECGAPILVGSWWDDHPNNGGADIGTLWKCTSEPCDYYEQF